MSDGVFTYLHGKGIHERCQIMDVYFKEALQQRTPLPNLQNQLPGLFEDIFVTSSTRKSWMLETDKGVVQTVLSLLKPEGLIFQAVVKFMSYSQLTLRFPLAMLPAATQAAINDKNYDALAPVLKRNFHLSGGAPVLSLNTFECFMYYFAHSVVVPLEWGYTVSEDNCHTILLKSYLEYFYPRASTVPSNRGNPWKIGNYENEALTNTFVEMITQFWLCQNNQTLLENNQFKTPTDLQLTSISTLLSYILIPIFQPQEPVKPPKGVHSPGTAPTVPWEADSLRAQSMLLYVYDLDETQSTSLFDQLILPLLYQFLKVTLASVDVGQTDRLQYLNKVVNIWSLVLQPWKHQESQKMKKAKDHPELIPANVAKFTQLISNVWPSTSDKSRDTSEESKRNYDKEFRTFIKPYVTRDNHIIFYTTLFRQLLARAQKSITDTEEQAALYTIASAVLSVKEFLKGIDGVMDYMYQPTGGLNTSFVQNQFAARTQALAIQQTILELDACHEIIGKLKSLPSPKIEQLIKVLCELYDIQDMGKSIPAVKATTFSLAGTTTASTDREKLGPLQPKADKPVYGPDGALTDYGRQLVTQGVIKCNKDAKYLGDPRFQPIRSENETLVKILISLSKFIESKTGTYYDLRFLGSYATWVALLVVFLFVGFIYLFTQLLTNSVVTDRNVRYLKAMRYKEENTL